MKEILLPVNLNTKSENLLAYAKSVAIRTKARITFFYAGTRRSLLSDGETTEYDSSQNFESFCEKIKYKRYRETLFQLFSEMQDTEIKFRFRYYQGTSLRGIRKECRRNHYDLLILGTNTTQGWRGYLEGAVASKLIGEVRTPVFVVPISTDFNQIEHITYATDLTDYDPSIMQQVKSLATIFDARLTIAHVNTQQEEGQEKYLNSLEQTISDTLDYPKVYYKFFDHADIFSGIKNFVNHNNTNMVAMINRKKFSWSDIFSPKSLTRKMAQDLRVPILAFSKPSA